VQSPLPALEYVPREHEPQLDAPELEKVPAAQEEQAVMPETF